MSVTFIDSPSSLIMLKRPDLSLRIAIISVTFAFDQCEKVQKFSLYLVILNKLIRNYFAPQN